MASQTTIEPAVLPLENSGADYEKLKLELESKAQADQGTDAQIEQITNYVANVTAETLRPIDTHFWSNNNTPILFPHMPSNTYFKLTIPKEYKWGFVYATGLPDDTLARKWIVAFDYAAGKVYSESGPMGPVDWNVIEVKLDNSGSKSEFAEIRGQTAFATFGIGGWIPS